MSASSLIRLEHVAEAAPGSWFQTYMPADSGWIDQMINRIERANFDALVLTVDVPVRANRKNLFRAGITIPLRPSLGLAIERLLRPTWPFGTLLGTLVRQPHAAFRELAADHIAPEKEVNRTMAFAWVSSAEMMNSDFVRAVGTLFA